MLVYGLGLGIRVIGLRTFLRFGPDHLLRGKQWRTQVFRPKSSSETTGTDILLVPDAAQSHEEPFSRACRVDLNPSALQPSFKRAHRWSGPEQAVMNSPTRKPQ